MCKLFWGHWTNRFVVQDMSIVLLSITLTGGPKKVTPKIVFANISVKSKNFKIKYYRLNGNGYLRMRAKFHQRITNRTKVISLLVSPPPVFMVQKTCNATKTILLSHVSNNCYETNLILLHKSFWWPCGWAPEVNLLISTSMRPSILLSFLVLVADCGISQA